MNAGIPAFSLNFFNLYDIILEDLNKKPNY